MNLLTIAYDVLLPGNLSQWTPFRDTILTALAPLEYLDQVQAGHASHVSFRDQPTQYRNYHLLGCWPQTNSL